MYPIGTKLRTDDGYCGTVEAVFRDGAWAKKFFECPWCDRPTWEVNTLEADLTETSGAQYLIADEDGYWRIVDDNRVRVMRTEPSTAMGEVNLGVKIGGSI